MANGRSQEKSWTVGDLMKKSELISEGTPALYRLITTRSNLDEGGKIRKWTFGQREINTQNKIILLVGETGTGKTSLINTIVNYTLGVKFDYNMWFEITADGGDSQSQPQEADQTESQTTEITVYEFFVQNNQTSVTIIDTPGYGDTRGEEYDRQIAEHLWKLFKTHTVVKEIDAVCLVVKASQNRLSDRQRYIFDAILSLFGKDIEENIVVFVTHSDGSPPTNAINAIKKANVPCRKENGSVPVHFIYNNNQTDQRTPKYENIYQTAWKLTEDNLKYFFTFLEDLNRKSLQMTESVLREQIQLKACVSNLRERIEFKKSKHEELTQIQKILKENQEKIQRNENFSFTVTRSDKEKTTIEKVSWWDRKATCCSVCEENCHEHNCWCAINSAWCKVMKDGHCTVCTGKCHHSKHIRENKIYVIKSKENAVTFTDLLKQYKVTDKPATGISLDSDKFKIIKKEIEINKKQIEEKTSIENRLKAELNKNESETTEQVEEAYTTIVKLSEIALKPDSAFIVESLDFLIPCAEEAKHPEWVQKLNKLREIQLKAAPGCFNELHHVKPQHINIADTSHKKSWTVGDLMKRSKLISEGKPALYRLITTRSNLDESGKIRKWTFGQREINTQNKIILLVGETGTGKTTVINTIVNYILGVKFDDDVWFEITEEREVNQTEDQSVTQTTEITVYEVFVQNNPISVTIIGTPGYGDTRGSEYDRQIAEHLWKLFKNDTGVKEIDAVCLVVKASQNRLSDRQHYIFDAILSLFGKDIEENIVVFVTQSDGLPPVNVLNAIKKANVPCKKENESDLVYFLFNNRQTEQRIPDYEYVYHFAWDLTEKSLKSFFASLEDKNRKSLEKTERVLTEQIQLRACVSKLREHIEIKEHKHEELTQIQEALKENQEKIQRNENFSFTVTRSYKEKVIIENASWWDRNATCCSVCKENCHELNCWWSTSPEWCEVMKDGHCTVCTGKCHHSKHIRENKKYVIKSKGVAMTFTDLKKQYKSAESADKTSLDSDTFRIIEKEIESNKKQIQENISIENRLKAELMKIEIEKIRLVEKAYTTIVKLSEITLKPDSAFIVETLDLLIPRAEEAGHPEWVQELKELREIQPEAEERAVAALRYLRRGLKFFFGKN